MKSPKSFNKFNSNRSQIQKTIGIYNMSYLFDRLKGEGFNSKKSLEVSLKMIRKNQCVTDFPELAAITVSEYVKSKRILSFTETEEVYDKFIEMISTFGIDNIFNNEILPNKQFYFNFKDFKIVEHNDKFCTKLFSRKEFMNAVNKYYHFEFIKEEEMYKCFNVDHWIFDKNPNSLLSSICNFREVINSLLGYA